MCLIFTTNDKANSCLKTKVERIIRLLTLRERLRRKINQTQGLDWTECRRQGRRLTLVMRVLVNT